MLKNKYNNALSASAMINKNMMKLPTPSNISYWWTFGSLLGTILLLQLLTGILLAMHYLNNLDLAFSSIVHITRDVNWGWLMRSAHANGASFFFILLYLHTGRGMYYSSYKLKPTWTVGVTMLLITMAIAFLGYVLPWGQMSFWGATVITNLLSTIPYLGPDIVMWLWGGFAVDGVTLTRFFTFHFFLPFILLSLVIIHMIFLHSTGSNNPLGLPNNTDFIPVHPFYTTKDITCFLVFIMPLSYLVLLNPNLLGDPENFNPANTLKTPKHIQPEWYYLFAYAILRAVPFKLGGTIALAWSIMILYTLPFASNKSMLSTTFYPPNQILFWMFISLVMLLTWIGSHPVKAPYAMIGENATAAYFTYFSLDPLTARIWDSLTK